MIGLLLVRHGQSEWNASGRWQGQADPPLSDLGRRQAVMAADRVGTVDLIVASDLGRAVHTAQIIAEAIGVGPVILEPALRERDAGEWSGLTRDEIEQRWPGYLAEGRRPPGFEAEESVLARTHDALVRLEALYEGAEIVVVTHGGVVMAVERHHGSAEGRLPNLGARQAQVHDGSVSLGERVLLVADEVASTPGQI